MGIIDLNNVSVIFQQDKSKTVRAVQNVNLEINKGDIFGIIGYSGAGKSTLVRTINLLQRPTEGTVTVNGDELTALSQPKLREKRKKIGMIFQHFNLLKSLTVFENVAFPLKDSGLSTDEVTTKVNDLLELVGLKDRAKAYPSQLSGGQKQRVAIARSLANDPEVLLCDEATSALDPKTTSSILELLQDVNRRLGITIVIITHEMAVVKQICNRVAVMEDGFVIEEGTILDLFTKPEKPLTQDFINSATHTDENIRTVINHPTLVSLGENDVLAKLSFEGASTGDPLISKLAHDYNVSANILFANVEIIQNTPVGTLLLVLGGKEIEQLQEAIFYIASNDVRVDIISKAQIDKIRQEGVEA